MSASTDPFAGLRPLLRDAIRRAVEGHGGTHAELLREQVARSAGDHSAALLCLLGASACGASPEQALPAAKALALLAEMENTFDSIAAEEAGGLVEIWGMPRTLNAGDAFFNLAQAAFLEAVDAIEAPRHRAAFALYDIACRGFSESLADAGPDEAARRQVLAAALALGALLVGAPPAVIDELAAAVQRMDGSASDAQRFDIEGITASGRLQLAAAANFLVEVPAP
jgi:hypothetical protein